MKDRINFLSFVGIVGLEPTTSNLSGSLSNQLIYMPIKSDKSALEFNLATGHLFLKMLPRSKSIPFITKNKTIPTILQVGYYLAALLAIKI